MLSIEKISLFKNDARLRELCLRLAQEKNKDVGMTYEWMSSLWESHFGKKDELTLLVKDENENPISVLPLYKKRERIKRVKVDILRSITGLYSTQGGLLISENEKAVLESLFEYLYKTEKWHIFKVCVQYGSKLQNAIEKAAKNFSLQLSSQFHESSPFIKIEGNIDAFLSSKSGNFRSNLKRKERKLKNAGYLELKIYTKPAEVRRALKEIFEIEEKSWKEQEGTAITSEKRRQEFYSTLAERMAVVGWLRIYILKIDGKPIAFDYGLLFKKRYSMLKTSYNESYKALSPGVVLRLYVVKDLFDTGCQEHNFMWGSEPYKLQWSNGIREYLIYRLYNKINYSRLLYYYHMFNQSLKKGILNEVRDY